jgi:hypothetical protein
MRKPQIGRGDTKLGCILWLLLLGGAAFVGVQAIPAQMKATELEQFMTRQAEYSAEDPVEKIRARVLGRIEELEIPLDKKAIHVERISGRIRITYSYTVPINLLVTTYDWPMTLEVDRLVIIV